MQRRSRNIAVFGMLLAGLIALALLILGAALTLKGGSLNTILLAFMRPA